MEYETKTDTIELGRAYFGVLLMVIYMSSSAYAMYGGEETTIYFDFPTTNCTIFPNETEGINFTFQGNEVIVSPALNFVGDFNITCYDWKTRATSGGGGSSGGWVRPTNKNTKVTTPVFINTSQVEKIIYKEIEVGYPWWFEGIVTVLSILGLAWLIMWLFYPKEEEDGDNDEG